MAKLWENTEALTTILETLQNKAAGSGELRLNLNNSMASSISAHIFADCVELGTATFPRCVDIGHNAFHNCSNLTEVTMAEGYIGNEAFKDCTNLQTVTMLSAHYGVSGHIQNAAFFGCLNLQELILLPNHVVTLESQRVFDKIPTVHVPYDLFNEYINNASTNGWGYCASAIKPLPETTGEEEGEVASEGATKE